jgi:hypothetical protein
MDTILDVFNSDPFTGIALTEKVERHPFLPDGLGELNLFEPNPIRTTSLAVEERTGKLYLVPFSARGTAGTQRTTEQRKVRRFDTPRLMTEDTLYFSEFQNIREFGQESATIQVASEIDRRLSGPTGLLSNIEYTKEYMRLAAVQGLCLNPGDGSILYNWFDEFQITQAAETGFNLAANVEGTLRPIINALTRTMARKSQGAWRPGTRMVGLCGDSFYDLFTNHTDVTKTFKNWQEAKELRGNTSQNGMGGAFRWFEFGDVVWMNYRGSDDNATIKVADDKVKFFPWRAPGVFREAMAPGESLEWVNTPGKSVYVLPIFDKDRRAWWKMEVYAYPLMICTRPEMLLSGRSGA